MFFRRFTGILAFTAFMAGAQVLAETAIPLECTKYLPEIGKTVRVPCPETESGLKQSGPAERAWLGVKIQDIDKDMAGTLGLNEAKGAIIAEVLADGPAAVAGLKVEDAILQVDSKKIDDSRDLARTIGDLPAKSTVNFMIWRNRSEQTFRVRLGTFPNTEEAPTVSSQEAKPGDTNATVDLKQLGLTLNPATAGEDGVMISKVDANSDAAQKGLRDGDVILKAAGQNVFSPQDVVNAVKRTTDEGLSAVMFHIKKGGEGGGQTVLVAVPLGKG